MLGDFLAILQGSLADVRTECARRDSGAANLLLADAMSAAKTIIVDGELLEKSVFDKLLTPQGDIVLRLTSKGSKREVVYTYEAKTGRLMRREGDFIIPFGGVRTLEMVRNLFSSVL